MFSESIPYLRLQFVFMFVVAFLSSVISYYGASNTVDIAFSLGVGTGILIVTLIITIVVLNFHAYKHHKIATFTISTLYKTWALLLLVIIMNARTDYNYARPETDLEIFNREFVSMIQGLPLSDSVNSLGKNNRRVLLSIYEMIQSYTKAKALHEQLLLSDEVSNASTPSRLASAKEIPPILDSLKTSIDAADAQLKRYMFDAPKLIARTNFRQAYIDAFIESWSRNRGKIYPVYTEYYTNQRKAINAMKEIYVVCLSATITLDKKDGALLFADPANAQKYAQLIKKLDKLATEEEALLANMLAWNEQAQKSFKSLEEASQ